MIKKLMLGIAVLTATMAFPAIPTYGATQDQCLFRTVQKGDQLVITSTQCFSSYAQVLKSAGAKGYSLESTPQSVTRSTLTSGNILGTHFDGTGLTGPSFSVVGDLCSGGGLNLPSQWNDRISSTANGCNDILLYQDMNYGGWQFLSAGGGTNMFGQYDNATSSIKYWG